jgi:hypothetical protein
MILNSFALISPEFEIKELNIELMNWDLTFFYISIRGKDS